MIIFLFGLPGVGKTYMGELIHKEFDLCYLDGDMALTDEMKLSVQMEQPFTREMTAELTTTIIKQINELRKNHELIIVSQAMLRETDRQMFREYFNDIHFIYIRCERSEVNQRITQRADFVTISYCEKLIEAFEPHKKEAETYPTIDNYNKTDEELIAAFEEILDDKKKINPDGHLFQGLTRPGSKTGVALC